MNIAARYRELEEHNKKRARIAAAIFALLMILILIFPFFSYLNPPPEQEGIMIAFGDPNAGGGYEEPTPPEVVEETAEYEEVEEAAEPETSPEEPTPVPNPTPDVKTSDNSKEIELKKQKEAERKKADEAKKRKAEAEAKKKAEAEAEAKRKAAEAERKRKLEEAKRKAGDKFKNGGGDGDDPGDQGDPNSDLQGGGTGGGTTGSGADVQGRSVKTRPKPPTNPGVNGNVVIKICIDNKGNVISANYTQSGSSVTSAAAIKEAESNAKKWKFNTDAMAPDKQCGTIKYNYKVK